MAGGAISWSSKLQTIVCLSSTEAEYIAAVEAGKEILWMRNILGEFGFKQEVQYPDLEASGFSYPLLPCCCCNRQKRRGQQANRAQEPAATSGVTEFAGNATAVPGVVNPSSLIQPHADFRWNADSGCTSTMTPHHHWIRNDCPHRVAVELADGSVIYSAGVGTVVIDPVIDGKGTASVELTRVLHVPQLCCNLLSCLFLTRCCGFNILIDSTFMHFKRSGMTLFRARITSSNAAFVEGTTLPAVESACAIQTPPLDWQLWHERLCHHNIADIAKLISGGLAIGISLSSSEKRDPVCEPCLAGKMHSGSFPSAGNRAALPCDLVHSDLCGPMSTSTPEGYRYWVVFIDDATRYRDIVMLKRKSECFTAPCTDDKGGEYMSDEFNKYCDDSGILRCHTTRNRPQQNGDAERANRTMLEDVSAMLYQAKLPPSFWGRCLATQTPYEAWWGNKPDLSPFRAFGCVAYIYIQKDKRKKLESHMEKAIFVGYPAGYKGWEFYNPSARRFIISEHAEFDKRYFPGTKMDNSFVHELLELLQSPPPPSASANMSCMCFLRKPGRARISPGLVEALDKALMSANVSCTCHSIHRTPAQVRKATALVQVFDEHLYECESTPHSSQCSKNAECTAGRYIHSHT
ncbi:hypothetical protein NMY22_g19906 [Coprinellus aureogranulatus]|nr:hypothetical protein NMY22_g19906 [Coprinellus aureogranulatus]